MWKCSNCETDNELKFCTNCRMSKEESLAKQVVADDRRWKCSRCGTEIIGNFCSRCRMPKAENDAWKMAQAGQVVQAPTGQPDAQAPMGQPGAQAPMGPPGVQAPIGQPGAQAPMGQPGVQPSMGQQIASPHMSDPLAPPTMPEQKSGNRGVIIAISIIAGIILLLVFIITFVAVRLLSAERDTGRDTRTVVEDEYDNDANNDNEDDVGVAREASPYNLDIWGRRNVVQLESGDLILDVPLPPNVARDELDIRDNGTIVSMREEIGEEWFNVWVKLGDEMEGRLSDYSDFEIEEALAWHRDVGEVLEYEIHRERGIELLIVYWDDVFPAVSFVKTVEFQGHPVTTQLGFETLEGHEEFFEVYGFNLYFSTVIDEVFDGWAGGRVETDRNEADRDEADRSGEPWTTEQMDSWWDLSDEYWEISDRAFDLYFFVWDYVILDDTIHQHYPNADIDRLLELHTEFDERFDELLSSHADIDFLLPYDSEHNQEAFEVMRNMIQDHEWFYQEFRAALEGR